MTFSPLRIVFAGTSNFAVPSLKALLQDPAFHVVSVITQPDRPTGRKQELTPPPVKVVAEQFHLHTLQPEKIKKEFASMNVPEHDFLVVVSYGQLLSQEILDAPTIAPVNVHASLLPRWRGASPLQHTILAGDRESGVTIQRMALELDAGPILGQESVTLDARETFTTLHDKLAVVGASLLVRTLKAPLTPTEQDPAGITLCGKLSRESGVADASTMTAEEIDRKVRGLTPWPGVTITVDGQPLKLWETALEQTTDSAPLPCADGTTLHLVSVQPASKKPMTGAAWARGRRA